MGRPRRPDLNQAREIRFSLLAIAPPAERTSAFWPWCRMLATWQDTVKKSVGYKMQDMNRGQRFHTGKEDPKRTRVQITNIAPRVLRRRLRTLSARTGRHQERRGSASSNSGH